MNLTQVLLFLFQGLSKSVDLPHAGLGTASLRGKERWTVKGGFIGKWLEDGGRAGGKGRCHSEMSVLLGTLLQQFPFWRTFPPHPYDFLPLALPDTWVCLAPHVRGTFPKKELIPWGLASSSWRGPAGLSSLSKWPCQTAGIMHPHITVGLRCTQPSLCPQVLSLLLGPCDGVFRPGSLLHFADEKTEVGRGASTVRQRV